MSQPIPIPPCDHQRLRQLLDGHLSASRQEELTRHLDLCVACRTQLEALAAETYWWQETRDLLSVGEADEAIGESELWDPPSESLAVPLDFLAPSDNPAMLGRLGEFEILEPLGCGGMGIVLKGYDHELNRYVAIKVLHPHCATSAAARRRFVREAQAAAAVVHQHVVAIHAVDAHHQPPYLVMPFVPGESLQQRLDRAGPLSVVDVLRIGQQVAEGLAAAHAQGLIHRDVKPGNILLERNVERVLLTDFGLARAADDASLTRSGVIAGTPQFMSPEQARGDAVDQRTDLFSLGTVLYTLLAGHSPFRAETSFGTLRRVWEETPRSLREVNPEVPEWLESLIQRLHAKPPARRPESAAQVAQWLKGCLAHMQQPMHVPLPPEVAHWLRPKRRWPLAAFFAALLAGSGLMGGMMTWPWHLEPAREPFGARSPTSSWNGTQAPSAATFPTAPRSAQAASSGKSPETARPGGPFGEIGVPDASLSWSDPLDDDVTQLKRAVRRHESRSEDGF